MKSKKLISFLCAAAMTVSSFAGLAITASAAETVLWSDNFDAYDNVAVPHTNLTSKGIDKVLVDGTSTADNAYDGIAGLKLQTGNRGTDTSFFAIQDGKDAGSKAIMATTASLDKPNRGGKIFFVDDEKKDKTYKPESGKDLVLAFNVKTTDTGVNSVSHILSINGIDETAAAANAIDFDTTLGIAHDTWAQVKVVINATSGATVYVDGTKKTTLTGVKDLSSIVFNAIEQNTRNCIDCPKWYFDDMVIYSSDDGAASTVPGAEGGEQATPPPEVDAPVLKAAEGATEGTVQSYNFNSVANGNWSIGTTAQQKYNNKGELNEEDTSIKAVPGLSIEIGGRPDGAEASTYAAIQKYGTGKVLNLTASRFATGGRGPRVSFDNNIPATEGTYTVTSFAFKISPMTGHEEDATARLSLLEGTTQAGDDGLGEYRHVAAVFTTKKDETIYREPGNTSSDVISTYVTPNEWHYASVVAEPVKDNKAPYRVYVDYDTSASNFDPQIKSDYVYYGETAHTLAKTPMFAIETRANKVGGVDTTPANAYALIDNIVAYSATGSEPRRVVATLGEPEEPDVPPVETHAVDLTVTGGETVKVTTEEETPFDAVLVHAQYNGTKLANVKTYPLSGISKTGATATLNPKAIEGDKLMVWDSLKGMVPYMKAHEVGASEGAAKVKITDQTAATAGGKLTFPNEVAKGSDVEITIVPDEGYELDKLTVGGTEVAATAIQNNKYKFKADADTTVSATFKKITYTVAPATGIVGGTVSVNLTTAQIGDEITVTVTPAQGKKVTKVTYTPAGGAATEIQPDNTTGAYKFKMPAANVTVSATFENAGTTEPSTSPDPDADKVTVKLDTNSSADADVKVGTTAVTKEGISVAKTGLSITVTPKTDKKLIGVTVTGGTAATAFAAASHASKYETAVNVTGTEVTVKVETADKTTTPTKTKIGEDFTVTVTPASPTVGQQLKAELTKKADKQSAVAPTDVSWKWQEKAATGETYTDVPGATSATFTPDKAGTYKAVATVGTDATYEGTVTSDAVTVEEPKKAKVTVTVDDVTHVTKIELKQGDTVKHTIETDIKTSNEIADVVYGTYDVVVTTAKGFKTTADTPAQLVVNAATATLAIKTEEKKFSVSGTATNVENVKIVSTEAAAVPANVTVSAEDGTFKVENLKAGSYYFTADAKSGFELVKITNGTAAVSKDAPIVLDDVDVAGVNIAATAIPTKPAKVTTTGDNVATTLAYTAHSQWGANKAETDVNCVKERFNVDSNKTDSKTYGATAFMQFYIPEIDDTLLITGAKLSFTVQQGGNGGRDFDIYKVNNDTLDLKTLKTDGSAVFSNARTKVAGAKTTAGSDADNAFTADKSIAISSDFIEAGKTLTLMLTANAGGAYLYGKPSDKAPVLTLMVVNKNTMCDLTIKYQTGDSTDLTPTDGRPTHVWVKRNEEFTATDAMTKDFKIADGKKYTLKADSPKTITPTTGTETLTLKFDESAKSKVTVNAVKKGETATVLEKIYEQDQVYAGDSVTVYFPRYIVNNNKLYLNDVATNASYSKSVTAGKTAVTDTVEYTEQTDTPVYYIEAENLGGAGVVPGDDTARMSKGKGASIKADTIVANLPKGKYKVTVGTRRTGGSDIKFKIMAGEKQVAEWTIGGSQANQVSDEFTLEAAADLVIKGFDSERSDRRIDYILVTGTKDPAGGEVVPGITGTLSIDKTTVKATEQVKATVTGVSSPTYEWYIGDAKQQETTGTFTVPAETKPGSIVKVVVKETGKVGSLEKTATVVADTTATALTTPAAADDAVQTAPTYGLVVGTHNFGAKFNNVSASAMGSFSATDEAGVLKVTSSDAKKVDLGSNRGKHYYIPVRITIPKADAYATEAPKADSKVLLYQAAADTPANWTADTVTDMSAQFQATGEFEKAWAADILIACDTLPPSNKLYFKLDLDGDGTVYSPKVIEIDVSGVNAAPPENLLKNPGFEGSEWAAAADSDWKYSDSTGKWQGHGTVTKANVTSSSAKEGDYVAKLDTGEAALGQKVTLEGGKTYNFSAWVKGDNATDTLDIYVYCKTNGEFPASGTKYLEKVKTALTTNWTEVTGTVTPTETKECFVYFYSKDTAGQDCGSHTAPIYIDNVSLVETDA